MNIIYYMILIVVSKEDHSKNDCLLVSVMSHGGKDGTILAADKNYNVQELWKNFTGVECKSMIGKPKLFFIQACRGELFDSGVYDDVDGTVKTVVTSTHADFLIMYSTVEGYYSFRNTANGSWFIQALCEELGTNLKDDFMCILARVNNRVVKMISNFPNNPEFNEKKQTSKIESTLTKSIYFFDKLSIPVDEVLKVEQLKYILPPKISNDLYYDISHAKRGVAIIFYHGKLKGKVTESRETRKKDAVDLQAVLEGFKFDVRVYEDLKLDEIKNILSEGKT